MGEQCRNCRFSKSGGFSGFLICRRYPPTKDKAVRPEPSRYPDVAADWWCGEWMSMRPNAGLPPEIVPPKPEAPARRRLALKDQRP